MDASAFVCDRTISVVRRKILSMFKNFWRINVRHSYSQRFASIRLSIVSLRQRTLEIAAVNKFAYRGQLICISSVRWRSRDASLRWFAKWSEYLRIEAFWIRHLKANCNIRKPTVYAYIPINTYCNYKKRIDANWSVPTTFLIQIQLIVDKGREL